MENNQKISFIDRINNRAKRSVMLKFFVIGIFILILLIPSSMVQSLIYERQNLRDEAEIDISSKWGSHQCLGGLVMTVPYLKYSKNAKGEISSETRYAHFLPEKVNIEGSLSPEKRYRGIYMVMLYNSKLKVTGEFSPLNLDPLNIPNKDFLFNDAFVSFGITDMKGIRENISLKFDSASYAFEPGIPVHDIFSSGISVPIKINPYKLNAFNFNLDINGSKQLNFLPFGKETKVKLTSSWPNPKFDGSFLPDKREIKDDGFTAEWKILQLNRNYPQQGLGSYISSDNTSDETIVNTVNEEAYDNFGVKLLLPIDEYQKNNRSTKYSSMFIFLTFLTLFFVEVLNKKRIHPIQYLLIGFAVVLFYVLLLSFSEHISFAKSYLLACVSILLPIVYYVWNMLKNMKLTAIVTGILLILYSFFYSLLQLEDYALLFGSLGMLIILALVMYLTRKVNWYNVNEE